MFKLNRTIWILFTALEMSAIVYLSVRPESQGSGASISSQVFHKFGHLVAYSILTYLLLRSFLYFEKIDFNERNKLLMMAFAIAVCFGAFNEFLQMFVPSRFARWYDILVNAIGSGAFISFVRKKDFLQK